MKRGRSTAFSRPPGGTMTAPAPTTPEPVMYRAGPMWDVMTGELLHPGQPRLRPLSFAVKDKQAEPAKPIADHTAWALAISPAGMSPEEVSPREKKPRTRRYSTPKAEMAPTPLADRLWLTVKQTAQRYPYSEGALRHLIWEAEAYAKCPKSGLKSNGFLRCIVRPGGARRVLIDAEQFERWLQGQ